MEQISVVNTHRWGESSEHSGNDALPTIFAITPTYSRAAQKADLVRLLNTLSQVPKFHWIVVEDGRNKSDLVTNLLS